jgi:lipoprotein-anchoring transpeptidase ErfK/SrfK
VKRTILRVTRAGLLLVLGGAAAFLAAGWLRTSVESRTAPPRLVPEVSALAAAAAAIPSADLPAATAELESTITSLQKKLFDLDRQLVKRSPRGSYIVIDTAHNKLWLRQGEKTLREATCSTGSGKLLEDSAGGRSWVFSTPRGEFHVTNRLENPTWRKPDWAFIEDGEPVPTRTDAVERFEEGVLGEYAMAFGDGFLIHGTLYTRLLGRSVTHGCVRLGPVDLKGVYDQTKVRTPIYIF